MTDRSHGKSGMKLIATVRTGLTQIGDGLNLEGTGSKLRGKGSYSLMEDRVRR